MEKNYYKATHKETKKWLVGETEKQLVDEIWGLISGPGDSEFLRLLQDNPFSIQWEEITKTDFIYHSNKVLTDPLSFSYENKKRKRGEKVPVILITDSKIENFDSVSALIKHLKGKLSSYKVKKMLEDPSLVIDGFSVKKA